MDYVKYIYNENVRPKTDYPGKLISHLIRRLKLPKGSQVLDLGCGRGDFSYAFASNGMKIMATDLSDTILEHYSDIQFRKCDFTKEKLPYDDASFDVLFSKSVIEHMYYPEELFTEAKRVLKPGGIVITMCPSWEHNYKTYFDDFTHRTPFMVISLQDFKILLGFVNVKTEMFKQLPFTWESKLGYLISEFIRLLPLNWMKPHSKLVKFSKETMLLSVAYKPDE